jgi:hypothetical protein
MTDHYNDDETINENWLAEEIAKEEGGEEEVDIAQIKEVLRITLELLAKEDLDTVEKTLDKH